MEAKGEVAVHRTLSDDEYKKRLIDKLGEELAELAVELGNPEDSLVDLREVINCLVDACGLSPRTLTKQLKLKE